MNLMLNLKKKTCFFLNLPGLMKKNQENHFSFFPEGSSNPLFNGNSTSSGTTQIISHTHTLAHPTKSGV